MSWLYYTTQVGIGYKKGTRYYNLTPTRKRFGKVLARGGSISLVLQALRNPRYQQRVVTEVGRIVRTELQSLCTTKAQSILRSSTPAALRTFLWDKVICESKTLAPNLVQLLKTCLDDRTPTKKSQGDAIIGLLVCILCKYRCPFNSLLQRVVSLVLYAGHCGKVVRFTRLKKLCASHKTTIRTLDALGSDFDASVLTWKEKLLTHIDDPSQVS